MEVEDDVRVPVLPGHRVRPQLLHEEHLVRELRRSAVPRGPCLLDPVGQVADKVEEEVALGHGDDLVGDLDEEGEALGGTEVQALADRGAEVLGAGARVDLEGLEKKKNIFITRLKTLIF